MSVVYTSLCVCSYVSYDYSYCVTILHFARHMPQPVGSQDINWCMHVCTK